MSSKILHVQNDCTFRHDHWRIHPNEHISDSTMPRSWAFDTMRTILHQCPWPLGLLNLISWKCQVSGGEMASMATLSTANATWTWCERTSSRRASQPKHSLESVMNHLLAAQVTGIVKAASWSHLTSENRHGIISRWKWRVKIYQNQILG